MAKLTLLKNTKDRVGTQDRRSVSMTIRDIPLGDIESRENIRTEYNGLDELAGSIRQYGLQQPITVYPDGDGFVVKTGHRRYLACRELAKMEPDRFHSIRCIISDEKDVAIIQLIENVQRVDLSQADLFNVLSDLREQGLTVKEIAEIMGKAEKTVKNWLVGVNEIATNPQLKGYIDSPAGGTILDVAETKGVPTPQRLELLEERGKGNLSRNELRQKAKILKETVAKPIPDDCTVASLPKVKIRAVIDFNLQEATFSLVNKIEGDAFDCLKEDILRYLQQTGKYVVAKELIPKDGPR